MCVMADSEEQSYTASYQPTMDLNRFRQLIREIEQENLVAQHAGCAKDVAKSSASGVFMLRHSLWP